MPLSNPKTVRFDEDEMAALSEKAEREERPIGFLVRKAVRRDLGLPEIGRNPTSSGADSTAEAHDADTDS